MSIVRGNLVFRPAADAIIGVLINTNIVGSNGAAISGYRFLRYGQLSVPNQYSSNIILFPLPEGAPTFGVFVPGDLVLHQDRVGPVQPRLIFFSTDVLLNPASFIEMFVENDPNSRLAFGNDMNRPAPYKLGTVYYALPGTYSVVNPDQGAGFGTGTLTSLKPNLDFLGGSSALAIQFRSLLRGILEIPIVNPE